MSIATYSVERPVTVCMVYLGAMMLGLIGLQRIPQELFPPITFPEVTIVTNYFNAAPEEIETLVTKPLEEAVSSVNGLKSIRSVSREGKSIISVDFDWNIDVDFAALGVREKIDFVKDKLPRDAEEPVVVKFDPLSRPCMLLSLTGKPSLIDLKEIAVGTIKDVLDKADGVASATVSGGQDREILIDVDQGRLYASGLSILALVESLEKTNLSYPAGTIKKGLYEHLIRTIGEFETIEDIAFSVAGTDRSDRIYVPQGGFVERAKFGPRDTIESKRLEQEEERPKKRLILFKDVAEIKEKIKEPESISRYDGKENVSIAVQKQAGANSLRVVKSVKEALKTIEEELHVREVELDVVYDESLFIKDAISGVRDAAYEGGILAFLVLLLFLRNWKNALMVTLAIPVSIIVIFFLMYIRNISINIMSLGGLALGVGMLTDCSIVVIENIFRIRAQGVSLKEAAIQGAEEVFWPVFSSTLTNIAVFFPLILFVPGVPGQIFGDLAWTVIMSNVMSLVVSASLIPMLAARIEIPMKLEKESKSMLHGILTKRLGTTGAMGSVLTITTIIFFISMLALLGLDREVLPKVDQGTFIVKVALPLGSRLEGTDEIVKIVEEEMAPIPEVDRTAISIGSAKEEGAAGAVVVDTQGAHQAQVFVTLKDKRDRKSEEVADELRERLSKRNLGAASVEFLLQQSEFQAVSGGVRPIQIEVQGYDLEKLRELVNSTKDSIKNLPGIFNVTDDQAKPSPETKIDIDKRKAALFGISSLDIAIASRTAIDGDVPSKFRTGGHEVDIRVRLREDDRAKLEQLGNLLIHSEPFEIEVPVKEIATITQGTGPSEIRHRDQQRTILVEADILPGHPKQKIIDAVAQTIQGIHRPEGFSVHMSGEAKDIEESFSRVIFSLILAVVLTYMIMAAQFESFLDPFIIMFTVPLSLIGVSFVFVLTNSTLNIIALLGIIMLGGIVVNNGIVLIEYINSSRRDGLKLVEACIEAACVRARPILMSAFTSVVGSVPLAFSMAKGSELRRPLALAVIGGLLSATILTLIVVPTIYVIFKRFVAKLTHQKTAMM